MFLNIRPIKSKFPKVFQGYINNKYSPRDLIEKSNELSIETISETIGLFKLGTTCKTTENNRHKKSDKYLINLLKDDEVILDIGASDGITSLNLLRQLGNNFKFFFVTDYNLIIPYAKIKNNFYFLDKQQANPVLINSNKLIFYPGTSGLLRSWFNKIWLKNKNSIKVKFLKLVQPSLIELADNSNKVFIDEYNVFEPWKKEKPTIIKLANVLNRSYFSEEQINKAITQLYSNLGFGGVLVVIDNRETEKSSFYRKTESSFQLIHAINEGSEINNLILSFDNRIDSSKN